MDKNNHNTQYTQPQPVSDALPDFRKIVQLAKKNWYLMLISFPLFVGLTHLYHRYTPVIYKGSVTVMMKSDEQRTVSGAGIIEGFGLSPETKSIENQTIILRSKKIVKRVIDKLDFGIEIHSDGLFKDVDMYHKSPYTIVMDSSHVQLLNTPIYIEPVSASQVKIKIKTENAGLHSYIDEKNHGGSGGINFDKTINLGDEINTSFCKFKINCKAGATIDVGYYFYFRSNDWLASNYRNRISVSPYMDGSSIIYISATGTNTLKINAFLSALSDVYLEQSLERKNEIAERTLAFIKTQLIQVSDTLRETQRKMMEFRRQHVFNAPTELSERLADQYFEYEKEISMLEVSENYYNQLSQHLVNAPLSDDYLLPAFSLDANSFITSFVTDLLSLHNERSLIESQTNEDNPILTELDRKIEVSKENLLVALRKILKNLGIKKEKLVAQMNKAAAKMNHLPETERQYLDIEREYNLNDAIYTFLLQKQSETQITKASNTPDNEILDDAGITGIVSPNKSKNNRQALFLAFLFPVVIIVLKEYLNNKIRDKNDLTSLAPQSTVLGYIPEYKGTNHIVIASEPLSSISESFRALRTKLKYLTTNEEKLVLSVTSTGMGEGKTFCALNLASVFAISGKKTVLLGFDLRKPRLTEIFDHHKHTGLSNYLIGRATLEEIKFQGPIDNLTIIPSGAIPPNPSELISSDNTEKLFRELKDEFDVVVVDSPPIGVVADARLLMEHSNCHLFVVRANKTIKEHFKHTYQNLLEEKVFPLGIIFNDISSNGGGYGYYSKRYYTDSNKS
ncbi:MULTISPECIES: GumC family protein [unclassified Saccharicrinis]|uniref:GumC family protein n=1 Tax=unclassified Saccharicrinis TaxID=2646859 RepID=UPI003D34286C